MAAAALLQAKGIELVRKSRILIYVRIVPVLNASKIDIILMTKYCSSLHRLDALEVHNVAVGAPAWRAPGIFCCTDLVFRHADVLPCALVRLFRP